ncbi:hypothetical protein FOA52_009657 [Chlamydomonas sp. UWO 241]|nr:hypothetical protein FOA52_009657 [Chlamydomonas sp. UWO 241]
MDADLPMSPASGIDDTGISIDDPDPGAWAPPHEATYTHPDEAALLPCPAPQYEPQYCMDADLPMSPASGIDDTGIGVDDPDPNFVDEVLEWSALGGDPDDTVYDALIEDYSLCVGGWMAPQPVCHGPMSAFTLFGAPLGTSVIDSSGVGHCGLLALQECLYQLPGGSPVQPDGSVPLDAHLYATAIMFIGANYHEPVPATLWPGDTMYEMPTWGELLLREYGVSNEFEYAQHLAEHMNVGNVEIAAIAHALNIPITTFSSDLNEHLTTHNPEGDATHAVSMLHTYTPQGKFQHWVSLFAGDVTSPTAMQGMPWTAGASSGASTSSGAGLSTAPTAPTAATALQGMPWTGGASSGASTSSGAGPSTAPTAVTAPQSVEIVINGAASVVEAYNALVHVLSLTPTETLMLRTGHLQFFYVDPNGPVRDPPLDKDVLIDASQHEDSPTWFCSGKGKRVAAADTRVTIKGKLLETSRDCGSISFRRGRDPARNLLPYDVPSVTLIFSPNHHYAMSGDLATGLLSAAALKTAAWRRRAGIATAADVKRLAAGDKMAASLRDAAARRRAETETAADRALLAAGDKRAASVRDATARWRAGTATAADLEVLAGIDKRAASMRDAAARRRTGTETAADLEVLAAGYKLASHTAKRARTGEKLRDDRTLDDDERSVVLKFRRAWRTDPPAPIAAGSSHGKYKLKVRGQTIDFGNFGTTEDYEEASEM